jgi:hypothetical protein
MVSGESRNYKAHFLKMFAYRCHEETASLNHQPRTRARVGTAGTAGGGGSLASSGSLPAMISSASSIPSPSVSALRGSMRGAQSKHGYGVSRRYQPVTGAAICGPSTKAQLGRGLGGGRFVLGILGSMRTGLTAGSTFYYLRAAT